MSLGFDDERSGCPRKTPFDFIVSVVRPNFLYKGQQIFRYRRRGFIRFYETQDLLFLPSFRSTLLYGGRGVVQGVGVPGPRLRVMVIGPPILHRW